MSKSKFVAGFLTGTLITTVVGVLFVLQKVSDNSHEVAKKKSQKVKRSGSMRKKKTKFHKKQPN